MFAPPHCAFILTLPARKHLASPHFGILLTFFFVPRKVCFLAMTMFEQARHCSFGLTKTFFFVSRKVRFLAMTMSEQVRHCSFGLTKTFFSCSLKSAFSRHDNVRASSTLFIWLNENVPLNIIHNARERRLAPSICKRCSQRLH